MNYQPDIPLPGALIQLTERVFYLPFHSETDRPVLGAVAGERGVLAVDAGASPAHARLFRDLLRQKGLGDISRIVLTHWHWDHVFGLSSHDALSFAHRETASRIRDMATLSWDDDALDQRVREGTECEFIRSHMIRELSPSQRAELRLTEPDIAFDSQIEISLGDCRAAIQHVGGDHSPDSSIVHIPREKVLFLGDCLYSNIHTDAPPYMELLFPMLEKILACDADWFIPSHTPPMNRRQMAEYAGELIASAVRKS